MYDDGLEEERLDFRHRSGGCHVMDWRWRQKTLD